MTFEEYARYVGSPENLAREAWGGYFADSGSKPTARKDNSAVFRERYARARLSEHQAAAIKWLAAQPDAPARILAISEDWSSDIAAATSRCSRGSPRRVASSSAS
jgi:hypothetical protein